MSGEDERKLFVAGLADAVTEDVLRQLFEAGGGKVATVTIPQDRATGRSRGFGFVTMESAVDAARARAALDGSMQGGRPMSVREFRGERPERGERNTARTQAQPAEDATLYIGNLPFTATADDITNEFSNSGFPNVARVHLPLDPEGRARGFGFVTMRTAEDARRAADELSGIMLGGRNLSVSVARARGTHPDRASSPPATRAPRNYGASEPRIYPAGARASSPRESSPPRSMPPEGSFELPVAPNPRGGDERRSRGAQPPERKKDKKRKNKGGSQERAGRRGGDGFSSSRASDYVDAWDDDD